MVYLKMSMEIQLIHQIEKHEFLYNFNLPEYNRKDIVEEAWASVAASTNMSISDCKEKWRNIRSSFLRSMKPSGSKVKKPYYLTEYLKFILPFLKPINVENSDDSHYEAQQVTGHEGEVVVDFIKSEPDEYVTNVNNELSTENGILSELLTRRPPAFVRKRRRFIPMTKKNTTELLRRPRVVTVQRNDLNSSENVSNANTSNSAIKMFLLSLLPELESMPEEQIRMFKIKTMTLIDDIKLNYTEMRQSSASLNSDRLQKRLINILLKTLHKNVDSNKNSD